MNGGLGLGVSHIGEGEAKNNARLAIVVEGAEFGLGGRRHDKA
jgi:hypothetical protein